MIELLYHAKRIHELNPHGYDYMEDIKLHLDGISVQDNCSTATEMCVQVVPVLKEALQQPDLCTAKEICDNGNQELVEKMLP